MQYFSFDKEDREVEDSDEEEEMNGNNDSDEEGLYIIIFSFNEIYLNITT